MRQLKTLVWYGLILVGGLYALVKLGVYLRVKDGLDEAVARVQPIAAVTYGGISSSIGGSVSVEGIEVRAGSQAVPLRVGTLLVEGPGAGFLYRVITGFDAANPPSWMRLSLKGVQLPDLRGMLPAALPGAAGASLARLDGVTDPCGLGGLLRSAGLLQSDRYPLLLDMGMGYKLDTASRIGRLEFGYQVHDRETVALEVSLSNMPQPGAVMLGAMPTVETIRLSYEPGRDFLLGRVAECARGRELEAGVYVDELVTRPTEALARELGFVPGEGLRQALRRLLRDPGEVLVSAGPIDATVQMYAAGGNLTPKQLLDLVDFSLTVGGEPVRDLSFELSPRPGDRTADGVLAGTAAGASGERRGAEPNRPRPRFLETPVGELERFVGRDVKVFTGGNDTPHRGVLVSVLNQEANVEQRLHGGTMTVHVPFGEIVRAEVFRYPDAPDKLSQAAP
jgi:hypothetical protein